MLYLYENLNRRATDIEGLERATDECADVLITLYRLVRCLTSTPLEDLVEQKMIINRARQWKSNGDGTGKHIRVTPDELATANKVWRTITEAL
ncbi:hypothetical protein [Caudoviricetes sp.]|nr:hypothetical protein [Caudoviricetes sp.]UOF79673.1 hypothetical protein [Caudoviricetes sp.]UOF79853.1 hypothetical protein [Bacteriophage sp.]UOF81344.1 hypothetical protein [Caudoviricetes sp.]